MSRATARSCAFDSLAERPSLASAVFVLDDDGAPLAFGSPSLLALGAARSALAKPGFQTTFTYVAVIGLFAGVFAPVPGRQLVPQPAIPAGLGRLALLLERARGDLADPPVDLSGDQARAVAADCQQDPCDGARRQVRWRPQDAHPAISECPIDAAGAPVQASDCQSL